MGEVLKQTTFLQDRLRDSSETEAEAGEGDKEVEVEEEGEVVKRGLSPRHRTCKVSFPKTLRVERSHCHTAPSPPTWRPASRNGGAS